MSANPLLIDAVKIIKGQKPYRAVDAGCGDGKNTAYLLESGFEVFSFDYSQDAINNTINKISNEHAKKLNLSKRKFEEYQWPSCELINASFSLFFCQPDLFLPTWDRIRNSIKTGGVFCGHLLGPDDSWAEKYKFTFIDKYQLVSLFDGFDIYYFNEKKFNNEFKRWHVYYIILIKK